MADREDDQLVDAVDGRKAGELVPHLFRRADRLTPPMERDARPFGVAVGIGERLLDARHRPEVPVIEPQPPEVAARRQTLRLLLRLRAEREDADAAAGRRKLRRGPEMLAI